MNVVMPLVAVGLVVAFDLPLPVKIALVALAISPVPPLLPNKEATAGGRVSYAIGLLVALALFSIVIVPITRVVVRQRVRSQRAHRAGDRSPRWC